MANGSTDCLMTFIPKNSKQGVAAECRAVLHENDKPKTDDFAPGHYFEIDEFSFSGGIEPDDGDNANTAGGSGRKRENTVRTRGVQTGGGQSALKKVTRGEKFAKYISEGSLNMTMDVPEISVSRQMDMASPVLFENCLKMIPFEKAVIVKRKAVGVIGADGKFTAGHHRIFLHLVFKEPLITNVEWADGDTIKETLKFISRGVTVTYIPQNDDGTLGAEVPGKYEPTRATKGGGNGKS